MLITTLTFFSVGFVFQERDRIEFPQGYFISPLKIPILLAGNFGEIRNNHFHAGLDIKTMSQEGQPVLAIADGYVSRINISSTGYGKALYITHPNGFTSVYGHLQRFEEPIASYLKQQQYERESFEVDINVDSSQLKLHQGQVVAYSGNTGASGGPHLHFEIRETLTEFACNPMLFGFDIEDNIRPVITALRMYPIGKNSTVNAQTGPRKITLMGYRGHYTASTVTVRGPFALAIEARDVINKTDNTQGIFSIEVQKDGERVFYHDLDKFGFHESRYINSFVDYGEKKRTGRVYQKCFLDPNNRLSTFRNVINRGIMSLEDDSTHHISVIVKDAYGNTSDIDLKVRNTAGPPPPANATLEAVPQAIFPYQQSNDFDTAGLKMHMPPNIFYDTIYFNYHKAPPKPGSWSVTHELQQSDVPVHGFYTLSIEAPDLPEALQQKAYIAAVEDGGYKSYQGGTYQDGWVTASVRSFGNFAVMVDETAPYINAINIYNGKNLKGSPWIRMQISDGASGIASYRGTIDGKWVLMEYDKKTSLLVHYFEDSLESGEHTFELAVRDNCGNIREFKAKFTR